jgi:hypothetical protein
MSICVTNNYLDPTSVYPVPDPRRTALPGEPQLLYGYYFAWDSIYIGVERTPGLSSCQMIVKLKFILPWDGTPVMQTENKEIQAWNIFKDDFVDRIGSADLGLPNSMSIGRAGRRTLACGAGADTVVLCRYFAWPRGRTALYSFTPQDFWDFWGGCTVTFFWIDDRFGGGLWGNQIPPITYPVVTLPDRSLTHDAAGTGFIVVFGGAGFAADQAYLNSNGFDVSTALPSVWALPLTPVDGTLVREMNHPEVFVVFGGAKFWIPDPPTLQSLFPFAQVRVIPEGGTAQIRTIPIDGTLLRGQHDEKVLLVENGQLRWVTTQAAMDSNCLAWRHVRVVPDNVPTGEPFSVNALAALPRGADIT